MTKLIHLTVYVAIKAPLLLLSFVISFLKEILLIVALISVFKINIITNNMHIVLNLYFT